MSSCVERSSHCFLALLFVPFTTKLDVPTVWLFGGFGEVVATHSQLYFLQLVVNTQVNSINSDVDIMLLRFIFLMIIIFSSAVIFLTIGTNGWRLCAVFYCLLPSVCLLIPKLPNFETNRTCPVKIFLWPYLGS